MNEVRTLARLPAGDLAQGSVSKGAQASPNGTLLGLVLAFILLQGAARKWFVPSLEQALFFVHVPLLAALYLRALLDGHSRRPLLAGACFAYFVFCQLLVQLLVGGYSLNYITIGVYGGFLLVAMVPLGFMIPQLVGDEFVNRTGAIFSWLLLLSLPLVLLQYSTDSSSIWNAGAAVGGQQVFEPLTVALGVPRTTGLQTSSLGQTHFILAAVATLTAIWLDRGERFTLSRRLLHLALIAAIVMVPLSGSRGLIVLLGLVVVAGGVGSVIAGRMPARTIGFVGAATTMVALLWPKFAPESFAAFSSRWATASALEQSTFRGGTFGRALSTFYGFTDHMAETPIGGYLIGIAGNAASRLPWVERPAVAASWQGATGWAEDSWSAHVVEYGPIVGGGLIAARILLVIYLGRLSIRAARAGNAGTMAMYGYVGPTLLFGQITQHGTVSSLSWFMTGLLLLVSSRPVPQAHRPQRKRMAFDDDDPSRELLVART